MSEGYTPTNPDNMSARSRTSTPPPQAVLLPGWEITHDTNSGLCYYAHRVSGQTRWDPPFINPQRPPPLPPAAAADPPTVEFAGLTTPSKSTTAATPTSTVQQSPPQKKSKTVNI